MTSQPDAPYFRVQAERCRCLASHADSVTALSLNEMAGDYEAMALAIIQAQVRTAERPVLVLTDRPRMRLTTGVVRDITG